MKGNKYLMTDDEIVFDIQKQSPKSYVIFADFECMGADLWYLDHEDNDFETEEEALEWLKKEYPTVKIMKE